MLAAASARVVAAPRATVARARRARAQFTPVKGFDPSRYVDSISIARASIAATTTTAGAFESRRGVATRATTSMMPRSMRWKEIPARDRGRTGTSDASRARRGGGDRVTARARARAEGCAWDKIGSGTGAEGSRASRRARVVDVGRCEGWMM